MTGSIQEVLSECQGKKQELRVTAEAGIEKLKQQAERTKDGNTAAPLENPGLPKHVIGLLLELADGATASGKDQDDLDEAMTCVNQLGDLAAACEPIANALDAGGQADSAAALRKIIISAGNKAIDVLLAWDDCYHRDEPGIRNLVARAALADGDGETAYVALVHGLLKSPGAEGEVWCCPFVLTETLALMGAHLAGRLGETETQEVLDAVAFTARAASSPEFVV